jgi:hypothetical protein
LDGKMKIGDVVIPNIANGVVFTSGCNRYPCAIVASVEPFVIVSVEADMMWSVTIKPEDCIVLCQASKEIVDRAVARWKNING